MEEIEDPSFNRQTVGGDRRRVAQALEENQGSLSMCGTTRGDDGSLILVNRRSA